jgi:hypothetical protein
MGPVIGGVLAFGLVVGCLLKGVFLLNDIKKTLNATNRHSVIESEEPTSHLQDKDTYLKYLKQKENPTEV